MDKLDTDVEPAAILADVCCLVAGNPTAAGEVLRERYPFVPSRPVRQGFSKRRAMEVFLRDGFIDRYSGDRLVNPGALRVISELLPAEFPYHPHGRRDESHIAYWELMPTVDHVVPLAQGGPHEIENFATTSMLRNLAKRNASLEQLDWTLRPSGSLTQWDGMSRWFADFVKRTPDLREVKHIDDWFRATIDVGTAFGF